MKPRDYKSAGVDIDGGEKFAAFIASIRSPALAPGIGGFAGGVEFDPRAYRQPILLSSTDGVGTKLMVAQKLKNFDTIGIDLVAMNVNDLAVCGAQPLSFLDYIACGSLDQGLLQDVIRGIVRGCELADCQLSGGETAEMPDLYRDGDFDLAGFCVGIVEKEEMLPRKGGMAPGDPLYGIPSSGIHSNGLSLARKLIDPEDQATWQELLTPTAIYVRELMYLHRKKLISGAAHITGGGLEANLRRVIPSELSPQLLWNWSVPSIFLQLQRGGGVKEEEMRRVFNMGVGVALVVPRSREEDFLQAARTAAIPVFPLGELRGG